MTKMARPYVETLVILAVVVVAAHYLVSLDRPWSIAAGAVVSVLVRPLAHRRAAARP